MNAPTPIGTEARVCEDIARRQLHGINKYGLTVAENPIALRAWLQHAYEESLDGSIYLRRAMEKLDELMTATAAARDVLTERRRQVDVAEWKRDNEATFHLLYLCGGHSVPREAIDQWTDDECRQAEEWAGREHLHASDNDDVERVPMPDCVKAHPPVPDTQGGLW